MNIETICEIIDELNKITSALNSTFVDPSVSPPRGVSLPEGVHLACIGIDRLRSRLIEEIRRERIAIGDPGFRSPSRKDVPMADTPRYYLVYRDREGRPYRPEIKGPFTATEVRQQIKGYCYYRNAWGAAQGMATSQEQIDRMIPPPLEPLILDEHLELIGIDKVPGGTP